MSNGTKTVIYLWWKMTLDTHLWLLTYNKILDGVAHLVSKTGIKIQNGSFFYQSSEFRKFSSFLRIRDSPFRCPLSNTCLFFSFPMDTEKKPPLALILTGLQLSLVHQDRGSEQKNHYRDNINGSGKTRWINQGRKPNPTEWLPKCGRKAVRNMSPIM